MLLALRLNIDELIAAISGTSNPSLTLDAAPLTGNGMIGAALNSTNSSTQWTAPTSWTEAHEVAYNTPASSLETCYRVSGHTSTTVQWTNANTTSWGIIVMELYNAGTGPTHTDNGMGGGHFGRLTI